MRPLQERLHRIKWDAEFARGEFTVGYRDRVVQHERVVPFGSISIDPGAGSISFQDEDGIVAHVPASFVGPPKQ